MPNNKKSLKAAKGKTGASVHLYELNGWMIPNGMSWKEFCDMRVMQGFSKPKKRKSLYLEDKEDLRGFFQMYNQLKGKHTEYSWKNRWAF